jgi:hypothetical protein
MQTIEITSMSLAQLVQAVNLVAGADAPDYKPIKTVPSKAKGVERLESLIGDQPVEFEVDEEGTVAGIAFANEEGDEGDEGDEPREADAVDAPFVKATKDELAAMDASTRADYRKRRRAAARAARKAAQA